MVVPCGNPRIKNQQDPCMGLAAIQRRHSQTGRLTPRVWTDTTLG